MAKRWESFEDLQRWLTGMATGLNDVIGQQVTDMFTLQGRDGIKSLCKQLDGQVLYLPMLVTPELAKLFESLETENQRGQNDLTVESYKRDIDNNRWLETGDAFRFNTLGNLVDGGHRARAIARSGKDLRSLVVFGVQPEAALVIDSGRGRTMANMLGFYGVKNSQEMGGIVPRLIGIEQGKWVSPSRSVKSSREEVLAYLAEHPELPELVTEATRRTSGSVRIPRATKTSMGIILAVLYRTPAHLHAEVHEFIEGVTSGAGLSDRSAALVLYRTLSKGAPAQWRRAGRSQEPGGFTIDETMALFFTAWNRRHEANVRQIKIFLPLSDENFPQPKHVKIVKPELKPKDKAE